MSSAISAPRTHGFSPFQPGEWSGSGGKHARTPASASGFRRIPAEDLAARPLNLPGLDFVLPPELEAGSPPEARGPARDEVRLLVSPRDGSPARHARFRHLGMFLCRGDLLVVNTSRTLPAALMARDPAGNVWEVHLSTRLPSGEWVIEIRQPSPSGTLPATIARPGLLLHLPGGGSARVQAPYLRGYSAHPRLWRADVRLPLPDLDYLEQYGFPIRYGYVRNAWPLSAYQTVYANEPGSAEMPSAGRAFTPELIRRLADRGIEMAPLILHTGVASPEAHEPPYPEFYRVPAETASRVNAARQAGRRVIAVGTTVVRALETAAGEHSDVRPGEGWTNLIITPEHGVRAVHGLITGFHEPRATHLAMLQAVVRGNPDAPPLDGARSVLAQAYDEALRERYLWHEFGDLHLIL